MNAGTTLQNPQYIGAIFKMSQPSIVIVYAVWKYNPGQILNRERLYVAQTYTNSTEWTLTPLSQIIKIFYMMAVHKMFNTQRFACMSSKSTLIFKWQICQCFFCVCCWSYILLLLLLLLFHFHLCFLCFTLLLSIEEFCIWQFTRFNMWNFAR